MLCAGPLPLPLRLELRLTPVAAFRSARFSDLGSLHQMLRTAHVGKKPMDSGASDRIRTDDIQIHNLAL
jgi:hypothetical protein